MEPPAQPNLRVTSKLALGIEEVASSLLTMLDSHCCRWPLQERCLPSVCLQVVNQLLTDMSAGFPDPFAVATINGEQTKTTGVIKKTLNPYWNESFDMYARDDLAHDGTDTD